MKISEVSKENALAKILHFPACKREIALSKKWGTNVAILCPHYSINIASKYEDGKALQWDLEELSEYLGHFVEVSEYDDLIVDLRNRED